GGELGCGVGEGGYEDWVFVVHWLSGGKAGPRSPSRRRRIAVLVRVGAFGSWWRRYMCPPAANSAWTSNASWAGSHEASCPSSTLVETRSSSRRIHQLMEASTASRTGPLRESYSLATVTQKSP